MSNRNKLNKDIFYLIFNKKREDEITIFEIINKLIEKKWFIFCFTIFGFICGVLIYIITPKEYNTTIKLIKENNNSENIFVLDKTPFNKYTYVPIIKSTSFLQNLLNIKFKENKNDTTKISLNQYLVKNYNLKHFKLNFSSKKNEDQDNLNLIEILNKKIIIGVMASTDILEISVTLKNPYIAAELADSIGKNLQNYINEYNNKKKMIQFLDTKNKFQESKLEYEEKQKDLFLFEDQYRGQINAKINYKKSFLENEYYMALDEYKNLFQQVHLDSANLFKNKDQFFEYVPATVSTKPIFPRFKFIIFNFTSLAFIIACIIAIIK